jgi:hypothetical protein
MQLSRVSVAQRDISRGVSKTWCMCKHVASIEART